VRVRVLRNLSPRRRWLAAGLVVAVATAAGIGGVRACQAVLAGPTGYPDQRRPGPVLLVPGYGGGQGALSVLAARIQRSGRRATVLSLPGDGTGDLTAQAATLDAAVADEIRHGAPSVDVIGYSAGGVVVRLWVAQRDGAYRARRVVTLGSPLHGARIAAVGTALAPGACPTACQQLVPGSSLLRQLDGVPLPAALPWLSVWTRDDETVQPPDSARLAGAVNVAVQDVCPDARLGHGDLPTDPLVTGLVLAAVGTGGLGQPGPADCAALRAAGAAPG
jgi:triacylglycerol esterase/lipase EstA (alpha/beta hydrolase family)